MNIDGPEGLKASLPRQLFLKGAEERAKELGYNLEVFYYGGKHYRSAHLDKVLSTRNIGGVILAGFYTNYTDIDLGWDRYSVVKIEALPLQVESHTVGNNQYQATRLGFRKLREMGFKRIGLCVAKHDEKHTNNLFSAGYLVEELGIPEDERVPLLVFEGNEFEDALGSETNQVADWIQENRIEVCLSNWNLLQLALDNCQARLGRKVYGVSLDIDHRDSEAWGVLQNHEIVGSSAVDMVTGLMQNYQKGLSEFPRMNLIDSRWRAPKLDIIEQIKADLHMPRA